MSSDLKFGFERLKVWAEAKDLAKMTYSISAENGFPSHEKYILISQMRRCSVSIASNIAEGTGRLTPKDKQRYITIAYGSALELMNQLIISHELSYIDEETLTEFRIKIWEVCAMLSGLKRSIK